MVRNHGYDPLINGISSRNDDCWGPANSRTDQLRCIAWGLLGTWDSTLEIQPIMLWEYNGLYMTQSDSGNWNSEHELLKKTATIKCSFFAPWSPGIDPIFSEPFPWPRGLTCSGGNPLCLGARQGQHSGLRVWPGQADLRSQVGRDEFWVLYGENPMEKWWFSMAKLNNQRVYEFLHEAFQSIEKPPVLIHVWENHQFFNHPGCSLGVPPWETS